MGKRLEINGCTSNTKYLWNTFHDCAQIISNYLNIRNINRTRSFQYQVLQNSLNISQTYSNASNLLRQIPCIYIYNNSNNNIQIKTMCLLYKYTYCNPSTICVLPKDDAQNHFLTKFNFKLFNPFHCLETFWSNLKILHSNLNEMRIHTL